MDVRREDVRDPRHDDHVVDAAVVTQEEQRDATRRRVPRWRLGRPAQDRHPDRILVLVVSVAAPLCGDDRQGETQKCRRHTDCRHDSERPHVPLLRGEPQNRLINALPKSRSVLKNRNEGRVPITSSKRASAERKKERKRKRRSLTPSAQRVDARLQTAPARRSRPANRPSCVATRTTNAKPAMAATMEPFCTFCFDTL